MAPRLEIAIDCPDPAHLAPFWQAALGYTGTQGDADPYLELVPRAHLDAEVFLQRVTDLPPGEPRIHLDLYVADPMAKVEQLLALGATRVGAWQGQCDATACEGFQVMRDPQGTVFCVCAEA